MPDPAGPGTAEALHRSGRNHQASRSLQPQSWLCPRRCPIGYSGLSCESCDAHFTRVPGGPYLGTCSGCNCNGHASSCDPVYGHCLVSRAVWHLDTG